jgi:DNA-binding transcriptional ArsR family regulator
MSPALVFTALADPRRRQILILLTEEPLPAGAIAARFRVSWPAISRHLRVLKAAGLVSETRSGRNRTYRVQPASLEPVLTWISGLSPSRPAPALVPAISRAQAPPVGREDFS